MNRVVTVTGSLVLSTLLIACQGQPAASAAGASDSDAPPLAPPPGPSDPAPGPSDDELRGKNPDLFEVALRYFPGEARAPGRKRLFRLTRAQLDLTTQSLLPDAYAASPSASQTLPRDPLQTNYEYADHLGFGQATFTPLTRFAEQLSLAVKARPASVLDCAESAEQAQCVEQATRSFVARAFRGTASEATLARYAAFAVDAAAQVGLAQAAAELVQVTLTSPGYLFRDEVTTGSDERLRPAQLLQNLAYTLTDSPPEALGLVQDATLDERAVSLVVQELLAKPAARAKLLRFFLAWLEVKEPGELDISRTSFPEFTERVAAAIVEDTRAFLSAALASAEPLLGDVTESNELSVADASSFLYGLDPSRAGTLVALDPAQRSGIFSQPAVIASHSGPTTTRLVKRGVFFTRKVMCLPLGAPPAGVDTSAPEVAMESERQRVERVTAEPRCAGCHSFINPFGFMLESYDAIGRFRERDGEAAVDPRVSVSFLDEGPFTATSSVEALRGFTRSLRFQQCFTRQMFRFYTGRDETADDDPLLRQLFFDFVSSRGDILQLLRGLASAAVYNSRRETP
jgi:Protein of unknown function (DUF1588)/Protein of unknown function (DUF1592)/Protein of unknown function (DUF1595)